MLLIGGVALRATQEPCSDVDEEKQSATAQQHSSRGRSKEQGHAKHCSTASPPPQKHALQPKQRRNTR
jgi:hypothetical protein